MAKQALHDAIELGGELVAGADLSPYTLVAYKADDPTKVIAANATTLPPIAVVGYNEEVKYKGAATSGGWKQGQKVGLLYVFGTIPVKLGGTVTPGQKLVSNASAVAVAKGDETFTDLTLGASPTGTEINTAVNGLIDEVQAARALEARVIGKVAPDNGGDSGDIVYALINLMK